MVVGTVPGAAGGWSESKPLEIFLEGERAGQEGGQGFLFGYFGEREGSCTRGKKGEKKRGVEKHWRENREGRSGIGEE